MKVYFLLIIIQHSNCWDLSFLNINNDYYVNSVTVYRSRVFLALPRSACLNNESDPTLIEIHWNGDVFNYFSKGRPKIISFQDWNQCDHIQDAITLSIEPIKPKLWILDKGNEKCEPKMLSYSLIFNNIIESTKLTNINGKNLNSLVIDPFLEDKFGHRAYIGHIEENTLLVFSLKTLIWWKIILSQPSIFSRPIKADFLAISKVTPELFITGKNELEIFSLNLEPLRTMEEPLVFETEGTLMTYQVTNHGKKLGKATGLETDYMSGLTYFMTRDYAILRWNTQFPLKAEYHRVLFQSYEIFPYISNFFTDSHDAIWALINPTNPNECISQSIPNLQTRVVPILKHNKFTKEVELVEINIDSKEDEPLGEERADDEIEKEEEQYEFLEEENKANKEYEAKEVYEAQEEYEVKEEEGEETVTKKDKESQAELHNTKSEKEYLETQKLKLENLEPLKLDNKLKNDTESDLEQKPVEEFSETKNEFDNNSNQDAEEILESEAMSELDKDLEDNSDTDSEYIEEYHKENDEINDPKSYEENKFLGLLTEKIPDNKSVSKAKAQSKIEETKKNKKKVDNDRDEAKIIDLVLHKRLEKDDISPYRQSESESKEDVDLEIEETNPGPTEESKIEAKIRKKSGETEITDIKSTILHKTLEKFDSPHKHRESEFKEDVDLETEEGDQMEEEKKHNTYIVSESQTEKALETKYNQESETKPGTTEASEIEAKTRKKKVRSKKKEANGEKIKTTESSSYEKLEQDDRTHPRPIKSDIDLETEESSQMEEESDQMEGENTYRVSNPRREKSFQESVIEADIEKEDVDMENTKNMKSHIESKEMLKKDDTAQYRQIEFDEDEDIEEIENIQEERYLEIYKVLEEINNKLGQELFEESDENEELDCNEKNSKELKSQETLHQDDIVQYQHRESEFMDNTDLDIEKNEKIKQERKLEAIHKKALINHLHQEPVTEVETDIEQEQTFDNKLSDELEIEMQNEDVKKEKMKVSESEMELDIEQELEEPET